MRKSGKTMALVMMLTLVFTMMFASISASAATKPKKMSVSVLNSTTYVGYTSKITVKSVSPKKASKAVTYTSSNKSIATVSKSGVVTPKSIGNVKITVKSKSNKKLKKVVTIKVKDPAVQIDTSARTVSFPAKVSNTAKSMHFVVNAKGSSAKYSLFTTNTTPKELSDALVQLGGTAWDTNYSDDIDGFIDPNNLIIKDAAAKNIGNNTYSHVNVYFNGKAMSTILKSYSGYDSVFANTYNSRTNGKSGCMICNTSCYYGVIADNNKKIYSGVAPNTKNIPAKGGVVTVTIQLK